MRGDIGSENQIKPLYMKAAGISQFSQQDTITTWTMFGNQFGKVLFDSLGGYADDFSEFSGRIVRMIFEQTDVGITSRPDTLRKAFLQLQVLFFC